MSASAWSRSQRLFGVDRRFIAAGLVTGAAVGAWASNRARNPTPDEDVAGLIDWDQARSIAITMNRGLTLTAVERRRLDAYYRGLVEQCVPMVSEYTGTTLPDGPNQTFAFDRVDWVNANLDAFRLMFAPIEALNPATGDQSVAASLWGGVNRKVLSAEVGLLLGYLARRVLGQYDLALLGREPVTSGKLYYVEPNILMIERNLALPREQFRMWLALHETTHAFEFEAHPWVRDYFNNLLEAYFEYLKSDIDHLRNGFRGVKVFVDRARTRERADSTWFEALMVPAQREIFTKIQALMCMVEGYSNHVMNAVGRELLPDYGEIQQKFERRQGQRGMAEQLFARLTGMDLKMEQYRLGQRFIDTIVEQRSHEVAKRIWDGPDMLPSMAEIRQPEFWLDRVDHEDRVLAASA